MIIIFLIKYMLYKNAHYRTILIFLNVITFLKIGCANLDAAPISPLFPNFLEKDLYFTKNL